MNTWVEEDERLREEERSQKKSTLMIGVVLFVGALTITRVRISGVYMRNNKLAGSDRPSRQSGPCSMLLMLPHDSTAIMLYRGGHDV